MNIYSSINVGHVIHDVNLGFIHIRQMWGQKCDSLLWISKKQWNVCVPDCRENRRALRPLETWELRGGQGAKSTHSPVLLHPSTALQWVWSLLQRSEKVSWLPDPVTTHTHMLMTSSIKSETVQTSALLSSLRAPTAQEVCPVWC